jgi:peptidylprolyl isomerase
VLIAANPAPPASVLPINAPAEIAANPANKLILQLSNGGTVVILMRPDAAPNHVARIQTLVRQGFYDGTIFHRVIPGFMAQGGDPTGTGEGGSTLPDLKAEFNSLPHLRGTVAAARAEPVDSANSQFYIMFGPKTSLDNNYTVFGRVVAGMDVVDKIAPGEPPANPTKIVHASLGDGSAPAARPAQAPSTPAPVEGATPGK